MHRRNKTTKLVINSTISLILYLFALNLMALGINLYLHAGIGIGSWDVLHNNLTEFYGLTFGTWVFIVGIITILTSQLLYLNFKNGLAIITGFILGKIIDLWLYHVFTFEVNHLYMQVILFFTGILLLGSGISLLVLTKLPPTPPDILMISVMKRFKLNFLVSKTITEATVFIVAIIVGFTNKAIFNNIGIGTLLTLITIGMVVEYSSKLWKNILFMVDKLKNFLYNRSVVNRE